MFSFRSSSKQCSHVVWPLKPFKTSPTEDRFALTCPDEELNRPDRFCFPFRGRLIWDPRRRFCSAAWLILAALRRTLTTSMRLLRRWWVLSGLGLLELCPHFGKRGITGHPSGRGLETGGPTVCRGVGSSNLRLLLGWFQAMHTNYHVEEDCVLECKGNQLFLRDLMVKYLASNLHVHIWAGQWLRQFSFQWHGVELYGSNAEVGL